VTTSVKQRITISGPVGLSPLEQDCTPSGDASRPCWIGIFPSVLCHSRGPARPYGTDRRNAQQQRRGEALRVTGFCPALNRSTRRR